MPAHQELQPLPGRQPNVGYAALDRQQNGNYEPIAEQVPNPPPLSRYRRMVYALTHADLNTFPAYLFLAIADWKHQRNNQHHDANMPIRFFGESVLPFSLASIMEGARYVSNFFWPLAFYSLLTHDLIMHKIAPNDRYGATVADIFTGRATNQLTFSGIYGTDIATDTLHWFVPVLLVASIASGATLQALYDWNLARTPRLPNDVRLRQLRQAFFWGHENRHEILRQIIHYGQTQHSALERLRALWLIDEIAGRYRPQTETPMADLENQIPATIYLTAINALKGSVQNQQSKLERIVAQYFLWSLGETQNRKKELFWLAFLTTIAAILYAKARGMELMVLHIMQRVKFNEDHKACIAQYKFYIDQPETGKYECGKCAGWSFVPVSNQDDSQQCMNGLLANSNNVTTLIDGLKQLAHHPTFTAIDLSSQHWLAWTDKEFNDFWDAMDALPISQLDTLNLSQKNIQKDGVIPARLQRVANFLKYVTVKNMDLHNLGLGMEGLRILLPGLVNCTGTMNLAYNQLGDDSNAIFEQLFTQGGFKSISLADNEIVADDVNIIFPIISNRKTISSMDISGNPIGQSGFPALANMLAVGNLTTLKLARIPLNVYMTDALAEGLSQSTSLTHLDVSQTGLNNVLLPKLFRTLPPSLSDLDISDNSDLTEYGISSFSKALKNSSVTTLAIRNNNALNARSFAMLLQLPLNQLDASGIPLDEDAINAISQQIPPTLKALILAKTNLGDAGMQLLSTNFANQTFAVEYLDVSNNDITPDGGEALLSLLKFLTLRTLVLRDNLVGSGVTLQMALYPHNVTTFDMANTKSDGKVLEAFVKRASRNTTLNFSINSVSDEEACNVALELMASSLSHPDQFGNKILSPDFAEEIWESKARETLSSLDLTQTGIGEAGMRCLLRAWNKGLRTSENLRLNPVNNLFPTTADDSLASTTGIGIIACLPGILLLYVLSLFVSQRLRRNSAVNRVDPQPLNNHAEEPLGHQAMAQPSIIRNTL